MGVDGKAFRHSLAASIGVDGIQSMDHDGCSD